MKYAFTDAEGKEIEVAEEKWAWCVGYEDGTEFRQFGKDGIFHQFAEVKQEGVEVMIMYETGESRRRFDMYLKTGMKIFHFYRNFIFKAASAEEARARVYCFGWKSAEGASEYHYILPSGNMMIGAGHDTQTLSAVVLEDLKGMGERSA